jgi:hypothetical protein
VALLLAALREDHIGMALLLADASTEEAVNVAIYCAFFAACRCREVDHLTSTAVPSQAAVLEALALDLAHPSPAS